MTRPPMTRPEELRQALAVWEPNDPQRNDAMLDAIFAAARCWLRLQEADEQTVEKVAGAMLAYDWPGESLDRYYRADEYRHLARIALAALAEGEK